jgi:hypothetical protein
MKKVALLLFALVLATMSEAQSAKTRREKAAQAAEARFADAAQLEAMAARFAPTPLRVDTSLLSPGDRQAMPKLIEAARILNEVFMDQYWSGDRALYQRLQQDKTALGGARLHLFWIHKGPWDDLNEYKAFIPGVPARKPLGANFYPEDMTKQEFENWVKTLPEAERAEAEGFFTLIRRGPERKLKIVPYSEAYHDDLQRVAALLREAAALTTHSSLKRFLTLRAEAFSSNTYFDSDVAWMDLDAPLDITIGPYETYNDELFGYKAAFEAYVNVRDERETARLAVFARHLQEIENNLPEDPKFRTPKLGPAAPIRVVNEVFSSGDGAHGVQTAAYNLPNDERVVKEKGSKRVMLKNVQEAKFRSVLVPIAMRVLPQKAQPDISFEMFFTHILAHELMHGLGPQQVTIGGRQTTPRQELKELYSAVEEAKADVTGLFALQYLMDHAKEMKLGRVLPSDEAAQRQLYVTYLASAFRSLRFGLNDAHGKGMALQFNYFLDKGAFLQQGDGSFTVNVVKMKAAVRELTHDLLTLEATGDYAGARRMLDTLGMVRPNVQRALQKLEGIPTDIEPIFVTADELTGRAAAVPEKKPTVKRVAKKRRRR